MAGSLAISLPFVAFVDWLQKKLDENNEQDNEQRQASEQFFAMQEKVNASIKSAAFQRALNFIADRDWAFYMELIKQEYEDINN